MTNLEESFLKEEIRDGFLVSKDMKNIWAVQLDLLCKFIEFCKKNDIKCFVIWGTLLGAVRHKGFIPWDDDVDVAMTRADYEKLKSLAPNAFEYPYFYQNAYTDKEFFMSYSRLRRSDTTGIIIGNESAEYNNGIFIDIYPLDSVPKSRIKYNYKRFFTNLYAAMARAKIVKNKNKKQRLLSIIGRIYSYEKCCRLHEKWCSKFNESEDEIGLFYHAKLVKKYHFDKSCIEKISELPFEGIQVPVPSMYESILGNVYGNYMEYPPVEDRGKWHDGQIIYDPVVSYKDYIADHYE